MATRKSSKQPARAAADGVSADLLKFLKGLKKHNTREWFLAHREEYEAARLEFTQLVRELIERIARFDPLVAGVDVHSCLFRVHRDVRFSRDKTPYKPHFSAFIAKDGKKSKYPGYYIHIEPGDSMAAGGIYHPEPENLALIRSKAASEGSALKKILQVPAFRKAFPAGLEGDRLKLPPRSYAKDHPHADLLCRKDFIVTAKMADAKLSKGVLKEAERTFKLMLPMQKWLADAVRR